MNSPQKLVDYDCYLVDVFNTFDNHAWDEVVNIDTIDGYKSYHQEFYDGQFVQEAKCQIADLKSDNVLWEEARKTDSIDSYQSYLDKNKKAKYLVRAKKRQEQIETEEAVWASALTQYDVLSFNQYLNKYPHGRHKQEANNWLGHLLKDKADWQRAKEKNIKDSYNDYLATYQDKALYFKEAQYAIELLVQADEEAWEKAQKEDHIVSYKHYVDNFPAGNNLAEALQLIAVFEEEDRLWNDSKQADTVSSYQAYLDESMKGLYIVEAEKRILDITNQQRADKAAWEKAQKINTTTSYKHYVDTFPKGSNVEAAFHHIAEFEEDDKLWSDSKQVDTVNSYQIYLNQNKKGLYIVEAEKRIQDITNQQREDKTAWEKAKKEDVIPSYRFYIDNFPNGLNKDDALLQIAELEEDEMLWQGSLETNTASSYQMYLSNNKKGLYIDEAEKRLQNIQRVENEAWEKTRKKDTLASYQHYIEAHPKGNYTKSAHQHIAEFVGDVKLWRDSKQADTMNSYQTYLRRNKKGLYIVEANNLIHNIEQDKEEWLLAKKENSVISYRHYLTHTNNSKKYYDDDARAAIAQLDENQWAMAVKQNFQRVYQEYLQKFPAGLHHLQAKRKLELLEEEKKQKIIDERYEKALWDNTCSKGNNKSNAGKDRIAAYRLYLKTTKLKWYEAEAVSALSDLIFYRTLYLRLTWGCVILLIAIWIFDTPDTKFSISNIGSEIPTVYINNKMIKKSSRFHYELPKKRNSIRIEVKGYLTWDRTAKAGIKLIAPKMIKIIDHAKELMNKNHEFYHERAIRYFRMVKDKPSEIYTFGKSLFEDKKYKEAAMVLGVIHDYTDAHFYLAYSYNEIGKTTQAITLYEKACDKKIGSACHNLGLIYEDGKNYKRAFIYYLKGNRLDSTYSTCRLANMYAQGGMFVKKNYRRAKELIKSIKGTLPKFCVELKSLI